MKTLTEIIGHGDVVNLLRKTVITRQLAHAYLFLGPEGVGKKTVACAFARALLCEHPREGDACTECRSCRQVQESNHPDFVLVAPTPNSIKIEQVREVQRRAALTPYQSNLSVCLIELAESMTLEAANCFLKTLEEPTGEVVFLLLSEQPYALLSTIESRCRKVMFHYLSRAQVREMLSKVTVLDEEDAELLALLSGGSPGRAMKLAAGDFSGQRKKAFEAAVVLAGATPAEAFQMAQSLAGEREELPGLLDTFLLWYRDLLIWRETGDETLILNRDFLNLIEREAGNYATSQIVDIIHEIEQAKNHLRAKANHKLTGEVLFMHLGRGDRYNL